MRKLIRALRRGRFRKGINFRGGVNVSTEKVILSEIKRLVAERDQLKTRLQNAEILIDKLKDELRGYEYDFMEYNDASRRAINLWKKLHPDFNGIDWPTRHGLIVWLMNRIVDTDCSPTNGAKSDE